MNRTEFGLFIPPHVLINPENGNMIVKVRGLLTDVATQVRDTMLLDVKAKQEALEKKIAACKEKGEFEEKAAKATDLPELLTFFQQGYHNVDTSDIQSVPQTSLTQVTSNSSPRQSRHK